MCKNAKIAIHTRNRSVLTGVFPSMAGTGFAYAEFTEILMRTCTENLHTTKLCMLSGIARQYTYFSLRNIEVYLTEREYLTDAEGKAIKKEAPVYRTSDVKAPADATPLHPGIAHLVERVNALQTKD